MYAEGMDGKYDLAFFLLGKYTTTDFIWGTLSSMKENNLEGGLLLGHIHPTVHPFITQVWLMKSMEHCEGVSFVAGKNVLALHWI